MAENLCRTSYKKFVDKYGLIENVTAYKDDTGKLVERGYFTNSIHVPVWEKVDPFTKIDIESQLTGYSNAGSITYVELDGAVKSNLEAVEQIINYAMDKDVPYFAMNFPIDNCLDCKYNGEIADDTCPKCGGKRIQRLRRVTGYITGDYKTAFNSGKIDETEDRNKHYGIEIK